MGVFDFLGSKRDVASGSPNQGVVPQTTTISTGVSDQSPTQPGGMYNGVGQAPAGVATANGVTAPTQSPGQSATVQGAAQMDKKTGMDIMTRLTQRSNRVLSVAAQKA